MGTVSIGSRKCFALGIADIKSYFAKSSITGKELRSLFGISDYDNANKYLLADATDYPDSPTGRTAGSTNVLSMFVTYAINGNLTTEINDLSYNASRRVFPAFTVDLTKLDYTY